MKEIHSFSMDVLQWWSVIFYICSYTQIMETHNPSGIMKQLLPSGLIIVFYFFFLFSRINLVDILGLYKISESI